MSSWNCGMLNMIISENSEIRAHITEVAVKMATSYFSFTVFHAEMILRHSEA